MRPKHLYIFSVLVLAVLIFQSFLMFYLVNTYAASQKNKGEFKFPPRSMSYFANMAYPEVSEIEHTMSDNPSDNEESPDSTYTVALSGELPPLESEIETSHENLQETSPVETEDEYIVEYDDEMQEYEYETYDETDFGVYYTDTEILYDILMTLKINQYIMLFSLAVASVIFIFKPIVQSYGNP